jgi:hypothetical protein
VGRFQVGRPCLFCSSLFEFEQEVLFTHARQQRCARIRFGWFEVRLPETPQTLWVLVAHDVERQHDLILLTNVTLRDPAPSGRSMGIGANGAPLSMAIASIKEKASTWKICGSKPLSAGAAFSP